MSTFKLVSIKEALEATHIEEFHSEKFGEESLIPQCIECDGFNMKRMRTHLNEVSLICWDCFACDELDSDPFENY